MSDTNLRSKHAFGSIERVDDAIARGAIDAYDILFLDEKKIGWIDKNGNKVILEDKEQVVRVDELPETGEDDVVYICNAKIYIWNGTEFTTPTGGDGVAEDVVDTKVDTAKQEAVADANAYTDEKIEEAIAVVEF